MSDFDPKELKILSDILALVLEDQPGQSATALETIKNRARKNNITGGALKNLFQAIAPDPSQARPKRSTSRTKAAGIPDDYRTQLRQMADSITRLDTDLRAARTQNDHLRLQLQQAQQDQNTTQSLLADQMTRIHYPSLPMIMVVLAAGILSGIAGTEVFHLIQHLTMTATDNARSLY